MWGKRVGALPAGESGTLDGMPSVALGKTRGGDRLFVAWSGDSSETSTVSPREQLDVQEVAGVSSHSPVTVPVPASPSSSSSVHSLFVGSTPDREVTL